VLVSQIVRLPGYPRVQEFFNVLDMHFSDVRAMLQLPRPDVGIDTGCNLAVSATLCNILSGISTTLYKPAHLLDDLQSAYLSGKAFQNLVQDFFPRWPPGAEDFPKELYDYARNPLVHSVGLPDAARAVVADQAGPRIVYARVLHSPHPKQGWTTQELNDLEGRGYAIGTPSIVITGHQWLFHADSFYFDSIELLRRLTSDVAQMQAAERRFQQGVYNWRR